MVKKILIALVLINGFCLFAEQVMPEESEISTEVTEVLESSERQVGGSIGIKNALLYLPAITGSINVNKFETNLSFVPWFGEFFIGGVSFGFNSNAFNTGWSHSVGVGTAFISLISDNGLSLLSLWGPYYRAGYRFSSNLMLSVQAQLPLLFGDGTYLEGVDIIMGSIISLCSIQIGLRYCFN